MYTEKHWPLTFKVLWSLLQWAPLVWMNSFCHTVPVITNTSDIYHTSVKCMMILDVCLRICHVAKTITLSHLQSRISGSTLSANVCIPDGFPPTGYEPCPCVHTLNIRFNVGSIGIWCEQRLRDSYPPSSVALMISSAKAETSYNQSQDLFQNHAAALPTRPPDTSLHVTATRELINSQ